MKTLAPIVLPPFSAIYGAIAKARLALYERGTLPVSKLDATVISIGNLTTGGTGKTPLVEWVARVLASEDRNVCILTRGYRRANPRQRIVVSDREKVLTTADEAGDEPFLLATKLTGIAAVVCDADRFAAGKWAIEELGCDTFVLDDGFQHLQLHRDLNIVTIDATNPWGGGHLLPYGRLREPLSGLRRAECIVLTRTEDRGNSKEIINHIRNLSAGAKIFQSRTIIDGFSTLINNGLAPSSALPANPVMAFCGIGNPSAFFDQLRKERFELAATRTFQDHHLYRSEDIQSLIQEANSVGARSLITTAKDAVKLTTFNFDLPCNVLEIRIEIEHEEDLLAMMRQTLKRS
jgi:tetraacyldisaccharide 4'-kinase